MDGAGVFEDCAVQKDAPLRLALGWRSRSTSIAGSVLGPLLTEEEVDVTLEVALPGHEVGGIVDSLMRTSCSRGRMAAGVMWSTGPAACCGER